MKKYFLLLIIAIFTLSCSKKVEVKAKINGGSPLDRIELIEASGVGTLPLINIGLGKDGYFTGSFEAPKNGLYVIDYAGRQGYVYLKGGQKFEFTADANTFPVDLKVIGDAKKNNDFINDVQKSLSTYASKIDMGGLLAKNENDFIKEIKKINTDVEKSMDDIAKKVSPDSDVVKYKKDELRASLLGLMSQYEINHPMAIQNPNFKVSKTFRDYEKSLTEDNDELIKSQPMYRNYILNKLSTDYQTFLAGNKDKNKEAGNSELFSKYLDTRKDLSQVTKDYLLAFIMTQYDISPQLDEKGKIKIEKLIGEKIKDNTIKQDLNKVLFVFSGPKIGTRAEETGMILQDGKSYKFTDNKGKPTLVMFYASWNPYINESAVPVMKEVVNFYKSKLNFTFLNFDDNKEQFIKSSNAMFKGLAGTNVYAEGGINSETAKKWGMFALKMPSFILIDKDGKVASKFYFNLADPSLLAELTKLTGLSAPTQNPNANLQNQLVPNAPQESATK